MSTSQERDADVDRLLRAVLKPAPRSVPGDCPDAGVLAAFVEGGLTAAEQSALEAHIVDCGRCQETLAVLSHDLPDEAAADAAVETVVPETRWFTWVTRPRLRWLVPISAAATVAVVFFATRPLIAPENAEVFPADVVQMAQAPPTQPAALTSAGVDTVREKQAAVPEKREADAAIRREDAAKSLAVPAPPRAPGSEVQADVAQAGRGGLEKPPADPAAGRMAVRVASEEKRAQPAAEPMRAMPATPQAREEWLRLEPVATVTAAPDGKVRWRFGPGGRIWRSTDAGSTWHWQPTDVSADLVAGSAPAPTTCWTVGTGGVVLLTVDGQRWTLLPFPLRVDLAAVQATSDRVATVTTRDGRRFDTLDAGLTWSPKQ